MRGLSAALGRLAAMPERARSALRRTAREAAEEAMEAAQAAAPIRTGRLRASICAEETGDGAKALSRCPYAVIVELGGVKQPAQPFLGPAARQSDYFKKAAQALKEELR